MSKKRNRLIALPESRTETSVGEIQSTESSEKVQQPKLKRRKVSMYINSDDITKDLKCVVCQEYPDPIIIVQCINQHNICNSCYENDAFSKQCPICRVPMKQKIRNRLAENIVGKLEQLCTNEGCNQMVKRCNHKKHTLFECAFIQKPCKYSVFGCKFIGTSDNRKEHERHCNVTLDEALKKYKLLNAKCKQFEKYRNQIIINNETYHHQWKKRDVIGDKFGNWSEAEINALGKLCYVGLKIEVKHRRNGTKAYDVYFSFFWFEEIPFDDEYTLSVHVDGFGYTRFSKIIGNDIAKRIEEKINVESLDEQEFNALFDDTHHKFDITLFFNRIDE